MEPSDEDKPPKPKRKRRWLWALLLAPVIAIITLAALLWTLPRWLTPETLRAQIERAVNEALEADFELASVDYDLAWGITLRGLRVGPPPGFTRDVARIEAIELRWQIPWTGDGELAIERAAIVRPELVIETKDGVRNVERLAPPSPPPPPKEPSGPLTGSLSPIAASFDRIGVERLKLELVGEGPELLFDGLSATLSGRVDPAHLRAALKLVAARAPIDLRLPDRRVKTALDLAIKLSLDADTHDGIALDTLALDVQLGLVDLDAGGAPPLPTLTLRSSLAAKLDGERDRFELEHLALSLGDRELARFGLTVDGVIAAIADATGDPTIAKLLGLIASSSPGLVSVRGPGLTLPLEPLMPIVRVFSPELKLGGELRLKLEALEGRVSELASLRPARAQVALELDRLAVAGPAFVDALDGRVELRAQGAEPLRISGTITGGPLRASGASVRALTLGLDGSVERPAYPTTGTASIAITLAVDGVAAQSASVERLRAKLGLDGEDPFDAARSGRAPMRVTLDANARGVAHESGAIRRRVDALELSVDAQLTGLLAPAEAPIAAKLALSVRGLEDPAARAAELGLRATARLDDPRLGRPIAASIDGAITARELTAEAASLDKLEWRIAAKASGVDPTGHQPLPSAATVDTKLSIPTLALSGDRPLSLPVRLELGADFRRAGHVVDLRALRAELGDTIDLSARGQIEDALSRTPAPTLEIELAPLDLSRPILARAIGEAFEGAGKIGLSAKVGGRWTSVDDLALRLDRPPLTAKVELRSDHATLRLPDRALALEDLDGKIAVDLSPGRTGSRGELTLGRASSAGQAIERARASWEVGLDEGIWRARFKGGADRLGDARASVEAASVVIDLAHPPFGEVDVRAFEIRAPGAGVEAELRGRLSRARYGAVRPDLALEAALDFDRLRTALSVGGAPPPALRGMSGKLGAELSARSVGEHALALGGALTLDAFSWTDGVTRVAGATGRVPFSQLLALDPPTDRDLADAPDPRGPFAESWAALANGLKRLGEELLTTSRVVLTAEDVLVIPPRTADYESLRPYYRAPSTAQLSIAAVEREHYRLRDMSLDLSYRAGVLRLDRFATRLWDGDIFGDMAIQIVGQDHLRLRLRSTITDLNLDVPVAVATGRAQVSGDEREQFLVSGNLDLRMDLRDRTLDGYFDFTKMGSAALVGLIDAMDPTQKDKGLQRTRASLESAATFALFTARFEGTIMSIRGNLLDMETIWDYRPFEFPYVLTGIIPISRLIFGPVVMNSLQPLDDYSLSNYLEGPWVKNLNQSVFVDALRGRLWVDDGTTLAGGEEP